MFDSWFVDYLSRQKSFAIFHAEWRRKDTGEGMTVNDSRKWWRRFDDPFPWPGQGLYIATPYERRFHGNQYEINATNTAVVIVISAVAVTAWAPSTSNYET